MLGTEDPKSWNDRMGRVEIAKAIRSLGTSIFFGALAIALALVAKF